MKPYKLVLLVVISIFFVLCSEDDESDSAEVLGTFAVEGKTYNLHDGIISLWYNSGDTVFIIGCFLHSDGIYYEQDIGYVGKGCGVSFFVKTDITQGESATFPITYGVDTKLNEAFDAELFPIYDSENDDSDYYVCTSGTVTVNVINDLTTIIIEAKANKVNGSGVTITSNLDATVNYTGEL